METALKHEPITFNSGESFWWDGFAWTAWDPGSQQWVRVPRKREVVLPYDSVPGGCPETYRSHAPLAVGWLRLAVAAGNLDSPYAYPLQQFCLQMIDAITSGTTANPLKRNQFARWISQLMENLAPGQELFGGVAPLGVLNVLTPDDARHGPMTRKLSAQPMHVFPDAVSYGCEIYPLDERVDIEVSVQGQVDIHRRPTLTRMALLSPLPGTALIPGLALQKKEINDNRMGCITFVHPDWWLTFAFELDDMLEARSLVMRLQECLDSAAAQTDPGVGWSSEPQSPNHSLLTELERIAALREQGLLTEEEAVTLKAAAMADFPRG